VIVLIVNQDRVAIFKSKCETPVAANAYRPMPGQIAAERMQSPSRDVHMVITSLDPIAPAGGAPPWVTAPFTV